MIRNPCGAFPPDQQIQAALAALSCSTQSLLCEGNGSVRATQGLSREYDRTPFPYGPQRRSYDDNNISTQLHAWKEKGGGGGGGREAVGVSFSEASKTLAEW